MPRGYDWRTMRFYFEALTSNDGPQVAAAMREGLDRKRIIWDEQLEKRAPGTDRRRNLMLGLPILTFGSISCNINVVLPITDIKVPDLLRCQRQRLDSLLLKIGK